jgi:hypothetical protein
MAKVWTALLETVLPHPCRDRPLVCDGLPDASQVIIIGENPATELGSEWDWWDYWHPQTGFDYDRFIAAYQREREEEGRSRLSATRLRLNRIREKCIRAVETNTYRQAGGSGRRVSNDDLLRLLIKNMPHLKAVIAHGDHVKDFMGRANLPNNLAVFRTKHFRFVSYREVDEICQQVASLSRY